MRCLLSLNQAILGQDFWPNRLNKNGLAHVADLPDIQAWRGACQAGSLCFIPTGCIFSERTLNGSLTMGWRCSLVESKEAVTILEKLRDEAMFAEKSAQALKKLIKDVGAENPDPVNAPKGASEMLALPPIQPQASTEASQAAEAAAQAKAEGDEKAGAMSQQPTAGAGSEGGKAGKSAGRGGGNTEQPPAKRQRVKK